VAKEKINCLLDYFKTVLGPAFQQQCKINLFTWHPTDKNKFFCVFVAKEIVKFMKKSGQFSEQADLRKSGKGYSIFQISDNQPLYNEAQVSFSNKYDFKNFIFM
jgi:hypothetical protein